jgi:hypothetical protein
MTGPLTTQEAKRQQVQQSSQHARDVETQEHHAKASASVRTHLSYPSHINAQANYSPIPSPLHITFWGTWMLIPTKAGLNLNLFGALSGAFSSKSKKTTHTNADGSSDVTEDKHDQGNISIYPILFLRFWLYMKQAWPMPLRAGKAAHTPPALQSNVVCMRRSAA